VLVEPVGGDHFQLAVAEADPALVEAELGDDLLEVSESPLAPDRPFELLLVLGFADGLAEPFDYRVLVMLELVGQLQKITGLHRFAHHVLTFRKLMNRLAILKEDSLLVIDRKQLAGPSVQEGRMAVRDLSHLVDDLAK